MDQTKKICPSAEELSKITSLIYCTEKGCNSVFNSKSNLQLHLAKTHKKEHLLTSNDPTKEYYCPETTCIYNNEKHFKKMKNLKQHYLKVHCEKNHSCDVCGKTFSTAAAANSHKEYCGVLFNCMDCEAKYPAYESLLTHCRRKKHLVLDKNSYKTNTSTSDISEVQVVESCKGIRETEKLILPKGSVSLQLLCYKVAFDKSSQTDLNLKGRLKRSKNTTKETQTFKDGKMQMTAETQTIGDFTTIGDENKKSIKTQTKQANSLSKSCNTSFNISETDFTNVQCNSSSTQTNVKEELMYSNTTHTPPEFEFIDTSSQTNFSEDMIDVENFLNSETQTDFMFEHDIINPDFYAHMCTQTGDDDFLNDLSFNDIHTQTNTYEMLRSVESQTMMSHNMRNLLSCRDIAHIETQTEEFKQLLEEINA